MSSRRPAVRSRGAAQLKHGQSRYEEAWPTEPQEEKQSFIQEHGGAIWLSVITTALAVLVTAAMTGSLEKSVAWFQELFDDDLPAEAIATWEFVGYEPGPPNPLMTDMTFRFERLTFHDESSYSATGSVEFAGSGSMSISGSGTFEMDDEDTLRMTNSADDSSFAVLDLDVDGSELRLTDDSAGVTYVFRKISE